jgi:pimeloyl-ACP methyl ester carboxylesterase
MPLRMMSSTFRFLYPWRVETSVGLRQHLLTIAVTGSSRVILLRDRLLRRIPWDGRMETAGPGVSRHLIHSGKNLLDGVLVRPHGQTPQASVLICHGIGETLKHWLVVQQMLAGCGVASLVFDYSGYGRSTGWFNARQAELDAVSAFHCLEQLTSPLPISVLGLSLGSGIAAAIVTAVPAHRLVLCAGFTSLREAAVSVGIPRLFALATPPIWKAEESLRACTVPVLIVHGEKDPLFSVRMAAELQSFCQSPARLVIVPGASHNDPFYLPQLSYWGEIVARFLAQDETEFSVTSIPPARDL